MSEKLPEVLFVCIHNAGRSQMAAAFLAQVGGSGVVVRSAGTAPAESINPAVIEAMAELDIDLLSSGATPKRLEDAAVEASDVGSAPKGLGQINMTPTLVITVCDVVHEELAHEELADQVQPLRAGSWLHWSVPDPVKLGTASAFDSTLDELTLRVSALVESGGSAA